MAETIVSIHTRGERRQQFIEYGWWVSIPVTTVPAHWVYRGENRLDGGYYTSEVNDTLRTLNDCGFEVEPLDKFTADIFVLDRFRRVYAHDKSSGWPYLSASEALDFRPNSDRYIAKDHAPKSAAYHFAKPGWLLVTASGSVGRMVLVTQRLSKYFLTHDLLRIVPKDFPYAGYLYAYLSSRIGQVLMVKDQYGSAIKHLEPHHLAGVPVPLLPEEIQAEIHAKIMQAYALRDEANDLLDESNSILHEKLGLPTFDENLVQYLPAPTTPRLPASRPEMPHPKAFSIRANEVNERFDGSYHIPIVRTIINLLSKGKYRAIPLRELAEKIHLPPRFKRIYVSKDYGVPFLRPSHLSPMRPYDLGYISRITNVLESLTLHLGDVMITTDGTVGRIGVVTSKIAGWAGSNNIARVTYGNYDFQNGYIAAFLSTPYGLYQLTREIYGGVVDHIEVPHIESVLVPNPPKDIQILIGKPVVEAFEKKDEACAIEEAAIRKVEKLLQRGKAP
jgi:type I restriction enzyme S subunit